MSDWRNLSKSYSDIMKCRRLFRLGVYLFKRMELLDFHIVSDAIQEYRTTVLDMYRSEMRNFSAIYSRQDVMMYAFRPVLNIHEFMLKVCTEPEGGHVLATLKDLDFKKKLTQDKNFHWKIAGVKHVLKERLICF